MGSNSSQDANRLDSDERAPPALQWVNALASNLQFMPSETNSDSDTNSNSGSQSTEGSNSCPASPKNSGVAGVQNISTTESDIEPVTIAGRPDPPSLSPKSTQSRTPATAGAKQSVGRRRTEQPLAKKEISQSTPVKSVSELKQAYAATVRSQKSQNRQKLPPRHKAKSPSYQMQGLKSPAFQSPSYQPGQNSKSPRLPASMSPKLHKSPLKQRHESLPTRIHSADGGRVQIPRTPSKDSSTDCNIRIRDHLKGAHIGNYVIAEAIGKGAMGVVYRAMSKTDGRVYAVKRIQTQALSDVDITSIENEISMLHELTHINIVAYVETIQCHDCLYIVMEYVENGSLSSIVKKFGGRFPESLVAIFIAQVLVGLEYLHSKGVVHRDIKCANILATKDGTMKLADFGVATRLSDFTKAHSVVGTPYWMAPEIISLGSQGNSCDLWSLGCTTIELLTGHPPYFDLEAMPAMFHIVQDKSPPLPDNISDALHNFLMLCFEKNPAKRITASNLLKHPWLKPNEDRQTENESYATEYNGELDDDTEMIATTIRMSRKLLERGMKQQQKIEKKRIKKEKKAHSPARSKSRFRKLFGSGKSAVAADLQVCIDCGHEQPRGKFCIECGAQYTPTGSLSSGSSGASPRVSSLNSSQRIKSENKIIAAPDTAPGKSHKNSSSNSHLYLNGQEVSLEPDVIISPDKSGRSSVSSHRNSKNSLLNSSKSKKSSSSKDTCNRCKKKIPMSDIVVTGGMVWHKKCFRCFECKSRFEAGTEIVCKDSSSLFCRQCMP